jgi:hypothetical protein
MKQKQKSTSTPFSSSTPPRIADFEIMKFLMLASYEIFYYQGLEPKHISK